VAGGPPGVQGGGGDGPGQVVALGDIAAVVGEQGEGLAGFDAFGDQGQAEVVAEVDTLRTIRALLVSSVIVSTNDLSIFSSVTGRVLSWPRLV